MLSTERLGSVTFATCSEFPVHDPIMLTLDVKDRNFARYVESRIGRADQEGFILKILKM